MKFNDTEYTAAANESVLDLLLRSGQDISFSCKSGSCQSCLLKALKGDVDADAQRGLKSTAIEQGHFMACQQPAKTIEQACYVDEHALFGPAQLIEKHFYNADICRLRLEPSCALFYHAGQFINLKNPLGVSRSYSLASVPSLDPFLELHIHRKDHGEMSNWIFESFNEGDFIELQGPIGECFYSSSAPTMDIVMIGTGTGAAPLEGIARDAIRAGHKGDVHFYHGAQSLEYLYLHEILKTREKENANFFYHPCLLEKQASGNFRQGLCNDIALSEIKAPINTLLYLCGNPEMVRTTSKAAFLSGVSIHNIFTDPFEYKELRKSPRI